MPKFLVSLLWFYHHNIVHGLGGSGPLVALFVLSVVCLFPSIWYDHKLRAAGVSQREANQRSQFLAGLGFVVGLIVALFFTLN